MQLGWRGRCFALGALTVDNRKSHSELQCFKMRVLIFDQLADICAGTWIMGKDGVEVVAAKSSNKSGHESGLQRHPGMLNVVNIGFLVTSQRETLGNWLAS